MRRTSLLGLLVLVGCHGDPVGTTGVGASGGASSGGKYGTGALGGSGGTSNGGTSPSGGTGAGGTNVGGTSGGTGGVGASGGTSGSGGSGNILVPGPDGAVGIAVDATDVYFGIGKDVWRAPKTGGNKQIVVSGVVKVREVAVSGGFVYFLDGDKTIRRGPIGGGNADLVVQGAGSFEKFGDIATDGTYAYYSTTTDTIGFTGSIMRVAVGGGVPFEIHKVVAAGDPQGIALFGGDVFWAQHQNGMLYKAPVGGGGATLLAQGLAEPFHVAANAEVVYWTESQGSLAYKTYPGGNDTIVPAGGSGADVVIDDKNAYFTAPSVSNVYGAPLKSTSAVVVATCTVPGALAIDATNVYVACEGGGDSGAVLKLSK